MKPKAASAARGADDTGMKRRKSATQQKVIGVMSHVLYGLPLRMISRLSMLYRASTNAYLGKFGSRCRSMMRPRTVRK